MLRRAVPLFALLLILPAILLFEREKPVEATAIGHEPGLLPNQWFWNQRAYPHNEIRQESLRLAIDQAQQKRAAAKAMRATDKSGLLDSPWELRGPTNVGARVTDLAVHPSNSSIVYAAMASGGVFKTTNGGTNWNPLFDDQAVLSCGAVALDPQNPERVWLGTGEANASSYSFFGMGIYLSEDGGQTWQNKGLSEGRYIARVVVDPTDGERVFAAVTGKLFGTGANRGVYRTVDGGDEWERCFALTDSTAAIDLVMNPDDPDLLYVAMWERVRGLTYRRSGGPSSGIWRTTDGGDTWHELTNGLPSDADKGRIGVTLCASEPDVLYALYADAGGYYRQVYKSTNGGDSWFAAGSSVLSNLYSSYGWYFGNVRVDPVNPDNVFVMGVPMYRSANGGDSWFESGANMHVDHHAMAFAPSEPDRVYQGNDGGLYYSTDSGSNWNKLNDQPTNQFYAIAIDELQPHRLYGGTQDYGTWRTPGGQLDDWEHLLGGDGFYCLVDPTNSDIIFAEYQNGGLNKSTNGGDWFSSAMDGVDFGDRINWSMPVVMVQSNPQVMYLGTHRVYRSNNQGDSWDPISEDLTGGDQGANFGTITTLAAAPSASSILYAGTDDGRVWRYSPLGAGWVMVSEDLPNRWVTRVAVDPGNASIAYATFSGLRWDESEGHVFKTVNGGNQWLDITGDLPEAPVNVLIVDPDHPHVVFVGTDVGCYFTTNEGATWQVLGDGLPNAPVLDLKLHQPTRTLVAGTYGRSMFAMTVPDLSGVEDGIPASTAVIGLANHPNPFNPLTTVSFTLNREQEVSLDVMDVRGRLVRSLHQGTLAAGDHALRWNGQDDGGRAVASGVYFARVIAGNQAVQHKMTLVR